MRLDNIKSQMRKGVLDYCILIMLSKQSAYTSDIIKNLKSAKLIVVEGTLYPLLTRLKNAELLTYRWEESTQGPPRKYYEITKQGLGLLTELDHNWVELQESILAIKTK